MIDITVVQDGNIVVYVDCAAHLMDSDQVEELIANWSSAVNDVLS